jgi:peptidoglycan/xylan/chitin deacetylase (PgdA/CDA1 family)
MYLPRQAYLARIVKKSSKMQTGNQKLMILLSSDTEFDPPLADETWKERSARGTLDGMPRLLELCDRYDASATFFCEAKLVERFPDPLKEVARKHEIGCHSYNHEWLGVRRAPRWIPRRRDLPVLSAEAKMVILRRAMQSIKQVMGRAPESFKAPFNSVDHVSTLSLLEQAGFDSDSSLTCYNNESFTHPLRPAPTHHVSRTDLWSPGEMRLMEVPFTIRPRPMLLHPFDVREEVMDTIGRGMKLAMESVQFQCRLDMLSGRDFSVVHVTSHPWEFSDMKPWGGDGRENIRRLEMYLDALLSSYDATFLTVSGFRELWEKKACPLHSRGQID